MKNAVIIIGCVLLVLGIAPVVMAIPDSNSIVLDGIEYYIQTDKSIYNLGEDVNLLYRVTNFRSDEWTVGYMPPLLDILVATKEGGNSDTLWFWSWDKWSAGPAIFHFQPGESVELNGIWPQIDLNGSWEIVDDFQVSPGVYEVGGRIGKSGFNDMISNAPVTLEITVIPEPSSLALFMVCLFALIKNRGAKHIYRKA
jgi:hypothetical protein